MTYLPLIIIFLLAGIGAEVVGFGISAISMAFIPLFLPLKTAVPLVALISLTATGIVAFRTKTTDLISLLWPLLLGSILGVPLGMYFLQLVAEGTLLLILGIILIFTAGYSLAGKKIQLNFGWPVGVLVGLLAGFFGASINVNGPLVGMYSAKNESLSKHKNKDLITTYMFLAGFFVVGGHYWAGRLTASVLRYFIIVLPALLIGLQAGKAIFDKVPTKTLRVIVDLFVLVAGLKLILS